MRLRTFRSVFLAVCVATAPAMFTGCGSSLQNASPSDRPPGLAMPRIFGDHMVIQQGRPVRFRGSAAPGSRVDVTVRPRQGEAIRSGGALADDTGSWSITMPALKPGEPLLVEVTSGDQSLTFDDVLVGEVWIVSGQSNMVWPVKKCDHAVRELDRADLPEIRLFRVKRSVAAAPQRNLPSANVVTPDMTEKKKKKVLKDKQNRWVLSTPQTAADISGIGFFFARTLHRELGVPVGLIQIAESGSPIQAWMPPGSLQSGPAARKVRRDWNKKLTAHRKKLAKYLADLETLEHRLREIDAAGEVLPDRLKAPVDPRTTNDRPHGLYNGMMAPFAGLPIRGWLWYQGENDAGRKNVYDRLQRAMVAGWREAWSQPSLPFLYAQLSSAPAGPMDEIKETGWARMREAQARAADQPNTVMIVTCDVGMPWHVHPPDKQTVARRFWRAAAALAYGQNTAWQSPTVRDMQRRGNRLRIRFHHGDGLHARPAQDGSPGTPAGVQIAGEDRRFRWARARIEDDQLIVWHEEIDNPRAVRYAWDASPVGNLYNAQGLPVAPFRTDDWEWPDDPTREDDTLEDDLSQDDG